MAGSIVDVTADKVIDPLTGVGNRLYFAEHLARVIEAYQLDTARHFAVLFLDLDRFKYVNDTLGHAAGDKLLRLVARRIESGVRQATIARFGGDEFALLLPETSLEAAVRLGERIRAAMATPIEVGGGHKRIVTLSIGAAALTPTRADEELKALADRLLAEADAALYRAKGAGRNRVATNLEGPAA